MRVRFRKAGPTEMDTLTCVRPDRTTAETGLPKAGVLPLLAILFVVETTLRCGDGVFAAVARGGHFTKVARQWSHIVAERLQAEQWSGPSAPADFRAFVAQRCAEAKLPSPELSDESLRALREGVREFGAAWRPLPAGRELVRVW